MTITVKGTVTDSATGATGSFSTSVTMVVPTPVPAPVPVPPPPPPPVTTPPHVVAANFTVAAGYGLDALVGHLVTDVPATSYTVVSCVPPASFAAWPSGNLRASETIAVPPGSYSLMVAASNAIGMGPPAAVNVVMKAAAPVPTPVPTPVPVPVPTPTPIPVPPPVTTGSYDNLNHWPSLNNRPVYNPSNHVLTWIGPAAGGPSTSSDPSNTQTLTSSGPITTTKDGQIIENLYIVSASQIIVQIDHNNVTLRRCYIEGAGGSDKYNVVITPGVTGTVIEDCEINGKGSQGDSGSFNIIGYNGSIGFATIRRNNLHDAEQMVARPMHNSTIIDNWMHTTQGADSDMIELYLDPPNDTHDLLIQHNTFQDVIPASAGFNSAINMSNWPTGASIYNINITGNRFLCPDFPHVLCDDNRQGTGTIKYSFTNNGLIHTIAGVQTGDNNGVSPNSGNFVLADSLDTTITGALFNGTGKI